MKQEIETINDTEVIEGGVPQMPTTSAANEPTMQMDGDIKQEGVTNLTYGAYALASGMLNNSRTPREPGEMPKHTISLYGPIDETNYMRAMESARRNTEMASRDIPYANISADYASRFGVNITVVQEKTGIDLQRLFGILRTDRDPGNMNHHGSQSDQALFMEALCMLGQVAEAKNMLAEHELASFK